MQRPLLSFFILFLSLPLICQAMDRRSASLTRLSKIRDKTTGEQKDSHDDPPLRRAPGMYQLPPLSGHPRMRGKPRQSSHQRKPFRGVRGKSVRDLRPHKSAGTQPGKPTDGTAEMRLAFLAPAAPPHEAERRRAAPRKPAPARDRKFETVLPWAAPRTSSSASPPRRLKPLPDTTSTTEAADAGFDAPSKSEKEIWSFGGDMPERARPPSRRGVRVVDLEDRFEVEER